MRNVNKNINLFEGVGERFPDIRVYCKDREESLEFESTMHKNGWTWGSGNKYVIRDDRNVHEVTFYDFDRVNKIFAGRKIKESGKDVVNYSIDKFGLINKLLDKKPSYNPKRIERTLEGFIGENFQIRYDRYKEELLRDNFLYVRANTNKEIDDFYEMLKKKQYIRLVNLKNGIDDWKKNVYEGESFYFSFKPNALGSFDVGYIIHDKDALKTYPHWMIEMSDRNMLRMLFDIDSPPNYEPRKFDRTLESFLTERFENKYIHDILIVKVDTPEESEKMQKLLFKNGIAWGSGDMTPLYLNEDDFPDYLTVFLNDFFDEPCITHEDRPSFDDWGDANIDSKLYTINDYEKIKNILEYGKANVTPSYEPKKTNRTLETYHIKTIKEFNNKNI